MKSSIDLWVISACNEHLMFESKQNQNTTKKHTLFLNLFVSDRVMFSREILAGCHDSIKELLPLLLGSLFLKEISLLPCLAPLSLLRFLLRLLSKLMRISCVTKFAKLIGKWPNISPLLWKKRHKSQFAFTYFIFQALKNTFQKWKWSRV